MTTINTGVAELLAVQVPEGVTDIKFSEIDVRSIMFITEDKIESFEIPADYTPLGLGSELKEEQWGKVVGKFYDFDGIPGWYDYPEKKLIWDTATASGLSLLASYGLNPATTFLLLKNKDEKTEKQMV